MGGSRRRRVPENQWLRYVTAGLGIIALLIVWHYQDRASADGRAGSHRPTVTHRVATGAAGEVLETLRVSDSGKTDGYDRDRFGEPWADVDGNGCDTRDDILARDMTNVKHKSGSKCVISSGTLPDPYTGRTITFRRGNDSSAAVQIDHVVALQDGWRSGASAWDATTRREFANDPLNLLATDGPANQAKGAKDASEWLPPNQAFDCPYVARQIAVKSTYDLTVTTAERDAMRDVLGTCPGEPLPTAMRQ